MIVRFAVSNFLSFSYSEQLHECINMIPSRPKNKIDHISDNNLLKSAVYFGGNGAGKSNIIKALRFLKKLVTTGEVPRPYQEIYCKNKPEYKSKPIEMEIEFLVAHEHANAVNNIEFYLNLPKKTAYEEQNDVAPVHYKYKIRLQNVGDNNPYNISFESISLIEYGRESVIVAFDNTLVDSKDTPNDKSVKDAKLLGLDEEESQIYQKIHELSIILDKLTFEVSEIDNKIAECERMMKDVKFGEDTYKIPYRSSMIRSLEEQLIELNDKKKELINTQLTTTMELAEAKSKLSLIAHLHDLELAKSKKEKKKTLKQLLKTTTEVYLSNHSDKQYETIKEWRTSRAMSDVFRWFSDTLVLTSVTDQILPASGFSDLNKMNELLPKFDAHIDRLHYETVSDPADIKSICQRMSDSELKSIVENTRKPIGSNYSFSFVKSVGMNIYEFTCSQSTLTIRKMVTIHHDGSVHQLIEESDGTRRLIELISALVDSGSDKVFIIDELDRRMHPLLTLNFVESFYNLYSERIQMIITTHETRLITTDLFRLDEINFVERDKDYNTVVFRAKDVIKDQNKRLDEMYLEDKLWGVPHIS